MNEEINKKRRPKTHGIIGRPSNAVIKERQRLCIQLINSNPRLSKKDFIAEYKKILKAKKLDVPTDQTIVKIAKSCNITFKNHFADYENEYTTFYSLGSDIAPYLKQIRVSCRRYDIKLLDVKTFSESFTKEEFLEPLELLKDARKKRDDATKTKTIRKTLKGTDLTYLYFILGTKGLEKHIENVFDTDSDISKAYLYSEVHNYCTKIVFELKKLDTIMDAVYEIVRDYFPL